MANSKRFHRPTLQESAFPDGTIVRLTEVGTVAYLSVAHKHIKHVWCVARTEGRVRYRNLIEQVEQELKMEGLLRGDTY